MSEVSVVREDALARVTICNAAKRNILTEGGIAELSAAFDELERVPAIRCVLLRGEGAEAFSAGYDLTTLSEGGEGAEADRLHALLDRVERYPFPVVASLRGYAVGGGCELALACDVRVAGDDVRMGMPPARLGLVYPLAGHARFLRTVGLAATSEIFYSGRIYAAPDCVRLGLVSVLHPSADSEAQALRLAREISENAPFSLVGTKKIVRHLTGRKDASPEDEAELAALFGRSLATEDLAEGKKALAERRKPRFAGR
jgi:enoyl-CoA hydratase/carnithine racemase